MCCSDRLNPPPEAVIQRISATSPSPEHGATFEPLRQSSLSGRWPGAGLAWTGLPQLILIPPVPKLMQRFDTRYIAFTGLAIFAYSCFMNTAMSPDYAGDQLWIPNIVRFSRHMEDQNDLARSAARAFKANVVTGGKGDKAELAAQPLLCTGRRNTWKSFSSDNSESLPCVSSRNDRRDPRISPA
jgi:hypothetical protein